MTPAPAVEELLDSLADGLKSLLAGTDLAGVGMIGVHTGGVWLAERLHGHLGLTLPLGRLDISFYRDDFSRIGMHPQVRPSSLPFDVEGRTVVLVDDVLYTGRTVRAALNEIFDYGRPACVRLAVLVDRDARELPIAADVTGTRLRLRPDQEVKLRGPDPLELTVGRKAP